MGREEEQERRRERQEKRRREGENERRRDVRIMPKAFAHWPRPP